MKVFPFEAYGANVETVFIRGFLERQKKDEQNFHSWSAFTCKVLSPSRLKFTVIHRRYSYGLGRDRVEEGSSFFVDGNEDLIRDLIADHLRGLAAREFDRRLEEARKKAITEIFDAMMAPYRKRKAT